MRNIPALNRPFVSVGLGLAVLLLGAMPAAARPLKLAELYELGQYVECAEQCPALPVPASYEQHRASTACLAACGPTSRLWEKNGSAPITRVDHDLAMVEYMDAQDTTRRLSCYADTAQTIVVPGALCAGDVCREQPLCTNEQCALPQDQSLTCTEDEPGGPRCWWPSTRRPAACPDVVCAARPARTAQDCVDADLDRIPAWLERYEGTNPATQDPLCSNDQPCGFDRVCAYDEDVGGGRCQARTCNGACTAFHLELVAEDDRQAIFHLHYDYSPVPARTLDLHLVYDAAALTLEDARPLSTLSVFGKQVATSHLSNSVLRVSVFDTTSSQPIPNGPIVELVFRRHTTGTTTVAFTTQDDLQAAAIAPLQGNQYTQGLLTNDALWGAPITLRPLDAVPTVLRLWYGFDSVDEPLTYSNVPTAEELCAVYAPCANEPDPVQRALLVSRLQSLQAGELFGGEKIEGLGGGAVYLDGNADHLRMPVTYREPLGANAQSFSWSTWFYSEGSSANENKSTPQVLFHHQAFNERTRFALALRNDGAGALNLVLLDGDILSRAPVPRETRVASAVPLRTWTHVGFTLDAASGRMQTFVNGEPTAVYTFPQPPSLVSCPQFQAGTDVLLHREGDIVGGRALEQVYTAVRQNNRYSIHRMDPSGMADTTLISDPLYSFVDPDYSPIVDRLVFASNASGAFEIWMADGDGGNRRQLTSGFGDASRGTSARRPRWAPDGRGIVFDSNTFDVLADENKARVRHIFLVGYDPVRNRPRIEVNGSEVEQLDYTSLVAQQRVVDFRLSKEPTDRHSYNADWLSGVDSGGANRGVLVFQGAAADYDGEKIHRLTIGEVPALSTIEDITGLGGAQHELRVLSSHHSERAAVPSPIITERLLYERSSTIVEPNTQFAVDVSVDGEGATVRVLHQPSGYEADCWDRNHDRLQDTDEDRNGDNAWDTADCLPHEITNLAIEFDAAAYLPQLEDFQGNPQTPGQVLQGMDKYLKLRARYPSGRALVQVEVRSPLSIEPIPAGEVAVLRFQLRGGVTPSVAFGTWKSTSISEVMLKDLRSAAAPVPFLLGDLADTVSDGVFSPDGQRLLLTVLSHARPVLLRTENLVSTTGAEKILLDPTLVGGMDWVRQDRFMACNWAAGYLHPQSKAILWGLRGGMDDLRIYSGLRDPDAFRSEAERGREFHQAAGIAGVVDSQLPSCTTSNLECPAYHLCVAGQCNLVPCDAADPYACTNSGGRCTLRPLGVEQEQRAPGGADPLRWVCAADCSTDTQCFSQACANGPCRFCDSSTLTCLECRETTRQLGALTIATMEGCPDQRSFRCESGTCVSDCYAYTDEQSVYLCDTTLEYCERGRCVLHDWEWWDLAPATLAGSGEMRRRLLTDENWQGYTQAVDQRIPVAVVAYGASDFGAPPEIVIEARGGVHFGNAWQRLGEGTVHARTRFEAAAQPIVVTAPAPFDELRLTLVTSPYENLSGGATGLLERDKDFCMADVDATAAATGQAADYTVCTRRAQGSRPTLGYASEITLPQAVAACRAAGAAGCPVLINGEDNYLAPGTPTAVVMDVLVNGAPPGGTSVLFGGTVQNRICAYGERDAPGAVAPREVGGAPRKLFYGDISTEISPERQAFCTASAENAALCAEVRTAGLVNVDPAALGHGLLNCNVKDPARGGETAGITISGLLLSTRREWPASSGAIVLDNGDSCHVELSGLLTTPCYSWLASDVVMDPMAGVVSTGSSIAYSSLDFGLFRGFGHDEGFDVVVLPRSPINITVRGLAGDSVRLRCDRDTVTVPANGGADVQATCPSTVKRGRRYSVTVDAQPSIPNHVCAVVSGGTGAMVDGGVNVTVQCSTARRVGGAVVGLKGNAVKLQANFSQDGVTVSGREVLELRVDGPYNFATPMLPGGAFNVAVRTNPPDQRCVLSRTSGTVGTTDVSNVNVTCTDVVEHALKFTVAGLAGSGLTVLERGSGVSVTATGNGEVTIPGTFAAGESYELFVSTQPTGPGQSCTFNNSGRGTMPDEDLVAGVLTCTTLPTYRVSGSVVGLLGTGLQLSLNGGLEFINVAPVLPQSAPAPFTFTTGLTRTTEYAVTATRQPQGPTQLCQVTNGTGTIGSSDVVGITIVCQAVADTRTFRIGGTVQGLSGSGLRLALNGGVQEVNVTANGSWMFNESTSNDSRYTVTVARQPSGPSQSCTLTNATGTVNSADVTNIAVSCTYAAPVTVQVTRAASDGAEVRALLFSRGGGARLVARAPARIKLEGGTVNFVMQEPAVDADAALPAGNYDLYVMVNHDGSTDSSTGNPTFAPGDFGAKALVTIVNNGAPPVKTFGETDLGRLGGVVVANVPGTFTDEIVQCFWSPPGAGSLELRPSRTAPVVGRIQSASFSGSPVLVIANSGDGVPPGTGYGVTCWVDVDGDGTRNTGDMYGAITNGNPSNVTSVSLTAQ